MFRTILLPIDFSEPSARAARFAAAIAYHTGSKIRAFTVETQQTENANHFGLLKQFVFDAADTIKKTIHPAIKQDLEFEFETMTHDLVSQAILEAAEVEEIDLVAMGTHGRSGLSALLLGSVTEQVIHELQKPLVAVNGGDHPVLSDAQLPHNILVAINFTDVSLAGLRQAVKLAELWQSRLLLFHSVEIAVTVPYTPLNTGPILAAESDLIEQANNSLSDLARNEIPHDIEFELIVTEGEPSNKILETIEERVVDLVVVSPRRQKLIERILLGSTTERLLHHCPVPVWVHQEGQYSLTN